MSWAPRSLPGSERGPPGIDQALIHGWQASGRPKTFSGQAAARQTSECLRRPLPSWIEAAVEGVEPGEAPSEGLRRVVLCAQEGRRHAHLAIAALDLRGGHREDLLTSSPMR